MNIREKILKLPVWKASAIVFLITSFIFIGIEELFISKVFRIINGSVTHFDKVFKEEASEVAKDRRDFDEKQEYMWAESKIHQLSFLSDNNFDMTAQGTGCIKLKQNKALVKLCDLAYVKRNIGTKQYVDFRIEDNNKYIKDRIEKKLFDPSKCVVEG